MPGRGAIARILIMPDQKPDADATLKKLGEHVRQGFAKKHPIPEKSLDTVRDAVREEWEKEQQEKRTKQPEPKASKDKDRETPDHDSR